MRTVWRDVEGLHPLDTNSNLATYQSLFAVPFDPNVHDHLRDRCACEGIQDEAHAHLMCRDAYVCALRRKFAYLFSQFDFHQSNLICDNNSVPRWFMFSSCNTTTWLPPLLSLISSRLPCSLFIHQLPVRLNLVAGSLLSPLDLCNTPTTTRQQPVSFVSRLSLWIYC